MFSPGSSNSKLKDKTVSNLNLSSNLDSWVNLSYTVQFYKLTLFHLYLSLISRSSYPAPHLPPLSSCSSSPVPFALFLVSFQFHHDLPLLSLIQLLISLLSHFALHLRFLSSYSSSPVPLIQLVISRPFRPSPLLLSLSSNSVSRPSHLPPSPVPVI